MTKKKNTKDQPAEAKKRPEKGAGGKPLFTERQRKRLIKASESQSWMDRAYGDWDD